LHDLVFLLELVENVLHVVFDSILLIFKGIIGIFVIIGHLLDLILIVFDRLVHLFLVANLFVLHSLLKTVFFLLVELLQLVELLL